MRTRVAIALISSVFAACWSPDEVLAPELATHVTDWRDEVIYQVMTDRFANGDRGNDFHVERGAPGRYHGGDFAGLEAQLPYIVALGATAIWISPVFKNVETDSGFSSYHGYWPQDFTTVNPHFGDMASLRRLVAKAHELGVKVILDVVVNHVGQLFYYDVNGNGQPDESVAGSIGNVEHLSEWDPDFDLRGIQGRTSLGEWGPAPIRFVWQPEINRLPPVPAAFRNPAWYHRRGRVTDWNDRAQVVLGDFPGGLKDLATERQDVRDAFVEIYTKWILDTDADAFRIDTVKHVEHAFWQDFCGRIRAAAAAAGKENFFQFGEVFDGNDALVGSYAAPGELDTLLNFAQKFAIDDVFKHGAPTQRLADDFEARKAHFPDSPSPATGLTPRQSVVNFLDNHDVARFLWRSSTPVLRAALAYVFFAEGIPDVYYGTEQDFDGGNDPANREDLFDTGYATEGQTFSWIAKLAALRKEWSPLRRGTMTWRWSTTHTGDEADAGILAFERTDDSGSVLVVINTSDRQAETGFGDTAMITPFAAGSTVTDALGLAGNVTIGAGGALRTKVAPHQVILLVPAK